MLILASQSATRKSLLHKAGLHFETRAAAIDERGIEAEVAAHGADAIEIARKLAIAKAVAVSQQAAGAVVIGADQTLALGGELFHKPDGLAGARKQLDRLRGRTHCLHAGIALARDGQELWSGVETAAMTMRDFSDAERDAVLRLEGEAAFNSVGAYRLEGPSVRLFETIAGDYFTILGLPLLPLLAALRRFAPEVLEPQGPA
ncbi:MAG TPA: Maf family protein [Arsenicitalea sp.]|jgi:septum formation protein|nr:Maf family protein [Arsenicitalea sp.]